MLIVNQIENTHFSKTEREIVDYIIDQGMNIEKMSANEIARNTFTSAPLLVRIAKKLGYSGFNEFKSAYLKELSYMLEETDVDASIPFLLSDDLMTITKNLALLEKETIQDTQQLNHHDDLQEAVRLLQKAQVIDVLNSFLGKSKQKPPIYSAIKVNGKKLYEYARNGEEVEIKERDIEIMMIELIDFSNNEIVFDVKCSKGTYIRSLCVDIAKKLGYPGHMSHLERRQAGRFLITDCITLEQLENDDYSLHSIDDALCGFPQLKLDDPTPVYHGKQIKSDLTGQVAIYDNQNHLLAIYESTGQGYLKNVRGLW